MPSLLQDSRVAEILNDEGRMRNITGLLELLQSGPLAANAHTRAQ
jgi:hypothetical protein